MYEEIKTACLYLRYSSSNQTEQSIEGQMHVCQDFCKRHNIRIVEMYIDRATSASKDIEKRVEFLKMIKDSEKGNFNAVIVYKLDRFARSRYDSATYKYRLKRNGVQLISATENITQDPEGIILESVLEGMAEFYSAELSQKINRGMRESAMKHNSIGGAIPLGYKTVDKKLVIDETTAPIVREAFQMYADGESVAEICRTFNNRGYKTSKGTRFGKSSFTKIFRNEKYIGVYKYHDYRAEDVIPPIIDKDLWDRVQVRVGKIKKAPARNKARHTYLLTGKLFCGHCGSAMNADGNSQGYLYYRCYGKKNLDKQCNKRNMEKNLIERLVAQDAMSFLTDEYIEKIATIACDRNKQEIESDSPIPVIRDRIRQVDVSLNNLLKAIETGSAPDMLVKRMGELETEKKDMEVQLKKEMAHQVYIDKEQVIFWLEKFREGDINDEEFCQTVIDLFVNSVTVWDEPDDKFKITIAYNLTSIPQKTYRLSKDGRLSDYASNTPPALRLNRLSLHTFYIFLKSYFCPLFSAPVRLSLILFLAAASLFSGLQLCRHALNDLLFYRILESSLLPCSNTGIVTFISWNQMHMEVEYRLSCCLTIVLYQIEAIGMKRFRHGCCHFFAENHCFRCGFIRNFINVCKMLFWKNQRMSFRCRSLIQNDTELIVLIQCRGWNFSVC